MKRWVLIAWLSLAGSLLLSACGQKGPLYLPDQGARPAQPDRTQ